MEGRHHILRHLRLQSAHLLCLQNLKSFHAVLLPLIVKPLQKRPILLVKAKHQRPVPLIWKIQLPGQSLHHPAALHVQRSLPAARSSVEAPMDNAAVSLGGALAHIAGPLQNSHLPVTSGQLSRDGTPGYAPADHNYVRHMYLLVPAIYPPVFCLIISPAYPKSKRISALGKIGQKRQTPISKKNKKLLHNQIQAMDFRTFQ